MIRDTSAQDQPVAPPGFAKRLPRSAWMAATAALVRAGGVIAQAAAELGLSRQALYRRMERHGLKPS